MEYNCQNCDQIITANFCSQCGQKKYKRIDKKYIWDEVQYTVLHTNKGFLYSVKNILKNPGKTAREFVNGNRVNHYKPISLAFVLSGISAFISFKVIGLDTIMKKYYATQKINTAIMNDFMAFAASYNTIIMLLLLPLFAIFAYIVFRKWGNNYYEHIVMNSFGLSFYTLVSIIILYPILYLVRANESMVTTISSATILTLPIIMVWFYKGFYEEKTVKSIILRVLFLLLLLVMVYFAIIIAGTILYIIIKGPEVLKNFQPR